MLRLLRAVNVNLLRQNFGYAVRLLGKNLGFVAVAVVSLALGIGANTAIFTLARALLLRTLPVRQPDRLVEVSLLRQDRKFPFSYRMFRELERGQRVFTGLVGVDLGYQWHPGKMLNVEVDGGLSQNHLLWVTDNFFSELGVAPRLGRLFAPGDQLTAPEAAVISHEFWLGRLGGAPDVIGKQIRVEGHAFTIIGVTPKGFTGLTRAEPPEITLLISAAPLVEDGTSDLERRGAYWLFLIGRLRDDVTLDQARAQLASFWPEVLRATADARQGARLLSYLSMRLEIRSASVGVAEDLRSEFTRPLRILMGLAGLTLLAACLNLANLLLAHATARSHEMNVRVVLGASHWSLARQLLIESLVLSFCGAFLGLAFADWACRLLLFFLTEGNSKLVALDLRPDLEVLSFTIVLAVVTGLLFGLVPAWRCSFVNPAAELRESAQGLSRSTGRLSKILVSAQVAFSLVLLLGAGLLATSLRRLCSADLGFEMDNVLEISLYPSPGGYLEFDRNSYHQQLLDRVSSVPGVISASYANNSIIGGREMGWQEDVSSALDDPTAAVKVRTYGTMISSGFFRTLRIPLLRGRDFNDTDDRGHPHVAIVNNSLAERLFPNGNALGKRVRLAADENIEIVGVADNARIFDLHDRAAPAIFLPYLQIPPAWGGLLVRSRVPPERLVQAIAHEIRSLGREYPFWTGTIAEAVSEQLARERVIAMLSGFFAVLALLLASIGLYGVMSYTVTRRTREIGIRVVLGAKRRTVLWMMLGEALALVLFGIALGIPAAFGATRLIAGMLFGVSANDPTTITAVVVLLVSVALLAGFLPARSASGVDPMIALRRE